MPVFTLVSVRDWSIRQKSLFFDKKSVAQDLIRYWTVKPLSRPNRALCFSKGQTAVDKKVRSMCDRWHKHVWEIQETISYTSSCVRQPTEAGDSGDRTWKMSQRLVSVRKDESWCTVQSLPGTFDGDFPAGSLVLHTNIPCTHLLHLDTRTGNYDTDVTIETVQNVTTTLKSLYK